MVTKRILQLIECHPEIVRAAGEAQNAITAPHGPRQVQRPERFPMPGKLHGAISTALDRANLSPAQ